MLHRAFILVQEELEKTYFGLYTDGILFHLKAFLLCFLSSLS